LRRAADVCEQVVRDNQKQSKERAASKHAMHTRKDIEQILGRIAAIGHIAPLGGEPDLTSETERDRLYREAQAKKQDARHPLKVTHKYGSEE
jgi:hypothetical protein